MPRHPQPVPPIYQPEVIARAVHWAAHHRRREFTVGFPTVEAIIGDKFIPGWLDYYLAYIGYEAQQTEEPMQPGRPDNLDAPLPGDHGARGEFSDRALDYSLQIWLNRYRGWLALGGLGLAVWWWLGRQALNGGLPILRKSSPTIARNSFGVPVVR